MSISFYVRFPRALHQPLVGQITDNTIIYKLSVVVIMLNQSMSQTTQEIEKMKLYVDNCTIVL